MMVMSEIAEILLSKYPSESKEDDANHAEAFAAEFDALWKAYMDHREDTPPFWSEASWTRFWHTHIAPAFETHMKTKEEANHV